MSKKVAVKVSVVGSEYNPRLTAFPCKIKLKLKGLGSKSDQILYKSLQRRSEQDKRYCAFDQPVYVVASWLLVNDLDEFLARTVEDVVKVYNDEDAQTAWTDAQLKAIVKGKSASASFVKDGDGRLRDGTDRRSSMEP